MPSTRGVERIRGKFPYKVCWCAPLTENKMNKLEKQKNVQNEGGQGGGKRSCSINLTGRKGGPLPRRKGETNRRHEGAIQSEYFCHGSHKRGTFGEKGKERPMWWLSWEELLAPSHWAKKSMKKTGRGEKKDR